MSDQIVREPREIPVAQALIGWATLAVVLVSVVPLGANRPVSWIMLSIAIFLLFTLQILVDLIRPLPTAARRIWPPALLFLGALVWAVIQIQPGVSASFAHPVWKLVPEIAPTISADPLAGLHHIMRLATYAMVFWISVRAAANVDRAIAVLGTIALFSTALAGFGMWAAWSGENPILGDYSTYAVSATFVNRNSYATYAIFGAITNLALCMHLTASWKTHNTGRGRVVNDFLGRNIAGGWLFGLGFLLCSAALVLTQSRAGTVSGLVALLTFAAVHRRGGNRQGILLFLTIGCVLAFIATALLSGLSNQFLAADEEDAKFIVYPLIVDGILARSYLGHGLGAFQDAFREFVPISIANFDWDLARNSYLENLFELGIPAGAAFYLALFWIAAVNVCGTIIRRRQRSFSCVAVACIAAAAFHSVFDLSLQMPATAALFAVILGVGWSQSFRQILHEPR